MARSIKGLTILVAGLVVGALAGGYIGASVRADAIVSLWVTTNAQHAEDLVVALEHARAGRVTRVLPALEGHLNSHVFGLMPSSWEGVTVAAVARERAATAKRVVQGYRERHPHDAETALDQDVRRFLVQP